MVSFLRNQLQDGQDPSNTTMLKINGMQKHSKELIRHSHGAISKKPPNLQILGYSAIQHFVQSQEKPLH
jgi:hypothetical protein